MASAQEVKKYLAHWFELGKKVKLRNGGEEILPKKVVEGDRYSQEFENCWQRLTAPRSGDCYLEGTNQTIDELLSSDWEINACARCNLPVPLMTSGIQPLDCTCSDLDNWPNTELPAPREPINSSTQLSKIRQRLAQKDHF